MKVPRAKTIGERNANTKLGEWEMNYWVNEPQMSMYTWMAKIHKETCYTVAKFVRGHYVVSKWHGPFATKGQALRVAESTGREVLECGHCQH